MDTHLFLTTGSMGCRLTIYSHFLYTDILFLLIHNSIYWCPLFISGYQKIISYCSYARSAQSGPFRLLGPFRSHSDTRLVPVRPGKWTTQKDFLESRQKWPMKSREKLFHVSSKLKEVGLIIEHLPKFPLGHTWRAVQYWTFNTDLNAEFVNYVSSYRNPYANNLFFTL